MISILVTFTIGQSSIFHITEGGSWSFAVQPEDRVTGIMVISDQPSVLSPACREEGIDPEGILPTR